MLLINRESPPESERAEHALVFGTIIWIVFILEFALRLSLAPDKTAFFRLLALYGFAVFGYIPASFATFFIG